MAGPRYIDTCYYAASANTAPKRPMLDTDTECDVCVVGGGFSGVSAALHLAEKGRSVILLEAEKIGWGASGRNGGFNCLGGAKLSRATWERRFGAEDYARYLRAGREATELVGALSEGRDIGRQEGGEWAIAHRPSDFEAFAEEAETLHRIAGIGSELVPRDALAERGLAIAGAQGAMRVDAGFPFNPRAWVLALAEMARAAGAEICVRTPVLSIAPEGRRIAVQTPRGRVLADRLILAANGYNSEDIPPWMAARYMPVISQIMVTEPLPEGGWRGCQMAYDTRNMLHYFRRLPDGRMLFGMRGALNDGPGARARMRAEIEAHFSRAFPEWAGARAAFHWAGLICATARLTPYVGPIRSLPGARASFGYHGNGVSMGAWCGAQVADLAMGRESDALPAAFRAAPPRIPLGRWRRALLPAVFAWFRWQDR